ncbi:MAG: dynamin family protein [Limnochordales bacterium]|nr:dynamin family protein [Limnochordales bacterium]
MITYYRKQKAEVISTLQRLNRAVARLQLPGGDRIISVVNAAIERLEQNQFNLAVCGIVKRGKSTFINSLLGEEVLPTGVIPVTSVVTYIRHGEEKAALVRFANGREESIDFENISQYCSERLNPGNEKQVESLTITYPSRYLKDGVVIADTPGVGSIHQNHTEFVYDFLPRANAIIFVFTVDPPIDRSELLFLKDVVAQPRKLMFVQTKVDRWSPEEVEESRAYLYHVLEQETMLGHPPVYPISARQALEARRTGDSARLDASGLPAFERALDRFLMNEKGRAALESAISIGLERAEIVRRALKVRMQAVTSKSNEFVQKAKEIQVRLDRIKETMDQINSDLEREWRIATSAYRNQVEATCYHLVRQLKDKADEIPDDKLTLFIRQTLTEHLAPVYQELSERMQEISRRCVMQARAAEAGIKEVIIQSLSTWGGQDAPGVLAAKAAGEDPGQQDGHAEADGHADSNLPASGTSSSLSTIPAWDWDRDLGPVANWALPVGLAALLFFGPIAALAGAAGAGFMAYRKQFGQRHREAKLAAIEDLADSLSQQAATQIQIRLE